MAIRNKNVFTGVLGSVVLRDVNGKQVVAKRMIPGTMKQTEATKLWSDTFGMASTLTAQFKRSLDFTSESYTDTTMTSRLTAAVSKILKDYRDKETRLYHFGENSFASLTGFNFNINSPVENLLITQPKLNFEPGLLQIVFPQLSDPSIVQFPKKSLRCRISINVALFRLKDGWRSTLSDQQEIIVLNDKKAIQTAPLQFTIPDGCLFVVTLFLEYSGTGNNGWRVLNDANFNPCCILGAVITPGIYTNNDNRLWAEMIHFAG